MFTTQKPFIGIAGDTGSGKSTVTTAIINKIGKDNISYMP
jgi:uridine kinase